MGAGGLTDAVIVGALARHGGNVSHAAGELDIPRTTLRWRAARIPAAVAILAARPHRTKPRRHTDAEILAAIEAHGTQAAAAHALGYVHQSVSQRVCAMRAAGGAP